MTKLMLTVYICDNCKKLEETTDDFLPESVYGWIKRVNFDFCGQECFEEFFAITKEVQ